MCWWIKVNEKYCNTVGDLRKAIYPHSDKIVFQKDYYQAIIREPKNCLCPVNKRATAAALGMKASQIDTGDWIFT